MNKFFGFITIIVFCIVFLMVASCFADPATVSIQMDNNTRPLYVGNWINAGTVQSIDLDNNSMVVRVLDNNYYLDSNYGMVTLQINDFTEIKIGTNNFLNFENLNVNDNIGFSGYWNGDLLSVNNIQLFQDPTDNRYFTNTYYNPEEINSDYSSETTIIPYYNHEANTEVMAPTNTAYSTMTTGYTPSAALSNLEIAKVIIRTGGADGAKINFRVRTFNGGSDDITGEVFVINLYIRANQTDQYELLKTWEEENVKSQDILSRDYFVDSSSPYVQMHNFQVKADLVDGAGNIFRTFEQDYAGTDIL